MNATQYDAGRDESPTFELDERAHSLAERSVKSASKSPSRSRGLPIMSLSLPGWMPDSSCIVCYSCDRPFSLFRRRHHCRQCGQIFCASCSRNVLNFGRACDYCANLDKTATVCLRRSSPANISADNAIKEYELNQVHERLQSFTNLAFSETMPAESCRRAIDLAIQATGSLVIRPDLGDARDPRYHVQIYHDRAFEDSFYIFGCVILKNVAHRRMRTCIENPKIMLLQAGIEYDRNPGRLTSIGPILEGEKIFLGIIIDKIMAYKPDILLSHRTVSGFALSLLLERNVTCIVNVADEDLRRVARCTGASILESVDQPDGNLGTCSVFRTHRSAGVSFCLFQGCKPTAGATIILNMQPEPTDMLSQIIVQAYNTRCELALEKDFGLNISRQEDGSGASLTARIPSRCTDSIDFAEILVADSWPCYRRQKFAKFYEEGDLTLKELLSEPALLSRFSCNECRRSPFQHSVIFEKGASRLSLQLKQSSLLNTSEIMTWATCSTCGAGSTTCIPLRALSVSSLQISVYRFIQMMLSEDYGCCRFCKHHLRSDHTRWFSVRSLTLAIVCSRRSVYSICPNLIHNNLPPDEQANPKSWSDFRDLALACLDDFKTVTMLQTDVDKFRSEMTDALHRQPFSSRDLLRARFKLLYQASVWNQACKDAGQVKVSTIPLNGDSVPVNIALALDSSVHRNVVQYLDSCNRRACIDALLEGNGESQIYVPNLSSDCSCTIYFPVQSAAIRRLTIGDDKQDQEFILSLNEVGEWIATGGKSDATFNKSKDNRLVIKLVKKKDVNVFKQIGVEYYRHLGASLDQNRASVLAPILGVYRVTVGTVQKHMVVTPNLFYGMRQVDKVFDLKGSSRTHRSAELLDEVIQLAATEFGESCQKETATLLDGNLLNYTRGIPLTLSPLSAAALLETLKTDTLFLSSKSIVDYSVLIGLDTKHEQIAIAIIDYLRVYSLDAMLETQVKSLGMLAGRPLPTVIPPLDYRNRFCRALSTYFALSDLPISEK